MQAVQVAGQRLSASDDINDEHHPTSLWRFLCDFGTTNQRSS